MFNATTSPGAEPLAYPAAPAAARRPGGFVLLVGLALGLLVGGLLLALPALYPTPTPFASARDMRPLQGEIRGRLGGAIADPLIAIAPGASARESNLRGFRFQGDVYYYYIEGAPNYDPLSRGAIAREAVEILLRDTSGPQTVVIYRIH